ncbi:hypothetical protein OHA98_27470 [Streptomyces sp. NBC_00654]|nr:hypothetical protein [Streptomyces sp. NBC_00654]MCX4968430.1 hypothetical protein [Streptomyces sp. NBC_00654]
MLPPPPPSQSAHFDFALNSLAVRNQVRCTRPAVLNAIPVSVTAPH